MQILSGEIVLSRAGERAMKIVNKSGSFLSSSRCIFLKSGFASTLKRKGAIGNRRLLYTSLVSPSRSFVRLLLLEHIVMNVTKCG